MTKAVLLRVGIDSGSGGIQGPLFMDGSFEYICIPDKKGVSVHTYGSLLGRNGTPHSDFFPVQKREEIAKQQVHLDPEFNTFTYGDPTTPKRSLRTLEKGDCLIFYAGLQRWNNDTGWNRRSARPYTSSATSLSRWQAWLGISRRRHYGPTSGRTSRSLSLLVQIAEG